MNRETFGVNGGGVSTTASHIDVDSLDSFFHDRIEIPSFGETEPVTEGQLAGESGHWKRALATPITSHKSKKPKQKENPIDTICAALLSTGASPISSLETESAAEIPSAVVATVEPDDTTVENRRRTIVLNHTEVDFYQNPTILSRLILNQKYSAAIQRVRRRPEETGVWVVVKRSRSLRKNVEASTEEENSICVLRQLPLHIACSNLCRTQDASARKALNELIVGLLVTNPAACIMPDHEGRLPVFEAIMHDAPVETICIFLMAEPTAVTIREPRSGKSLYDVCQFRDEESRQQLERYLSFGPTFWMQSRKEADIRLRAGNQTLHFPSNDLLHEETSTTPLASSQCEMDTIVTNPTVEASSKTSDDSSVHCVKWEQLEARAIATEQILTEINERNFELHRRLHTTQKWNRKLKRAMKKLNQENAELSDKIETLQLLMDKTLGFTDADDAADKSLKLRGTECLDELKDKYQRLYLRYHIQGDNVRILKTAISSLILDNDDDDDRSEKSPVASGNASSLTWSSDSGMLTAPSRTKVADRDLQDFPWDTTEKSGSFASEVKWTPTPASYAEIPMVIEPVHAVMQDDNLLDDSLSRIFEAAASRRRRHQKGSAAEMVEEMATTDEPITMGSSMPIHVLAANTDDLSVMLRYAAQIEFASDDDDDEEEDEEGGEDCNDPMDSAHRAGAIRSGDIPIPSYVSQDDIDKYLDEM